MNEIGRCKKALAVCKERILLARRSVAVAKAENAELRETVLNQKRHMEAYDEHFVEIVNEMRVLQRENDVLRDVVKATRRKKLYDSKKEKP
jgi:regulator of replication initiation timing